ncbi:MAG: SDR family NAD(P)-dependent oxidoreductase [Halarcobacter sp.]
MIAFQNKKILIVTTNNLDIEKDIAIALSNLGATIVFVSSNEEIGIKALSSLKGNNHKYFNLNNSQNIDELADNIISYDKKGIDAYIHCAKKETPSLLCTENNELQSIFNVNIVSYLNFIKYFSKSKKKSSNISILYLFSDSNKINAAEMSKTLSLELFEENIKINSLQLGEATTSDLKEDSNKITQNVIGMVSYLISENASFIVGEVYKLK